MFDFLKKLFSPKTPDFFPGILDNAQTLGGAIPQSEVVGVFAEPVFPVRKETDFPKYPYQYQSSSSSCVAHGMAKICTVLYFLKTGRIVKFSPGFYYTRRVNKPALGMWYEDIIKMAGQGNLPYDLLPSEGFGEKQMNDIKIEQYMLDCADGLAIDELKWVDTQLNFKNTASTIEITKKPVKIWLSFGPGEFFGTKYPKILGNDTRYHHEVVGVATGTINGKQYIKIEDSADKESLYEKFIDANFFKRCDLSRYPLRFKFDVSALPTYTGTIESMQDCLRADGLFPKNIQSTPNWGPTTDESVKKFCVKYGVTFVPGRKMWQELSEKLYLIYK